MRRSRPSSNGGRRLVSPSLVGLVALLFPSVSGWGCDSNARTRPNILLLSVDTLRADRVGAFGHERPTSPAIDALAEESIRFARAQTQAPWTLPSIASMVTGMPCTTHGCWSPESALDTSFETLAEVLLRGGYDTLAVANQPFLSRQFGLHQGFVHYDGELTLLGPDVTSERVSNKLIQRLEWKAGAADDRPWFLWGHYFDPHRVLIVHEGFSDEFGTEAPLDRYDGEVRFTDHHVGRVLDRLDELGLADSTVVVFVTDHGDAYGDHGLDGHGNSLYEELIRSPMLLRVPGVEPRVVNDAVQVADVFPTLLELAGLPLPAGVDGRSLVPLFEGDVEEPHAALSELKKGRKLMLRSLTVDGWKLIENVKDGSHQLFHLEEDPLELRDLAREQPERTAELARRLERRIERAAEAASDYSWAPALSLSPGDIAELEALGYADAISAGREGAHE